MSEPAPWLEGVIQQQMAAAMAAIEDTEWFGGAPNPEPAPMPITARKIGYYMEVLLMTTSARIYVTLCLGAAVFFAIVGTLALNDDANSAAASAYIAVAAMLAYATITVRGQRRRV